MKYRHSAHQQTALIWALAFSVLIHFSAAAVLIGLELSGGAPAPSDRNVLNMVWVSFDNKKADTGKAVRTGQQTVRQKKNTGRMASVERPADSVGTVQLSLASRTAPAAESTLPEYENRPEMNKSSVEARHSGGFAAVAQHPMSDIAIAYPLYRENTPPVYPEMARLRGYEGIVLVFAEILPTGRVGDVKIRKSSGYAILDQSAIQAVKPWKFEPAKKAGNPFTAWVELPIKFILQHHPQS